LLPAWNSVARGSIQPARNDTIAKFKNLPLLFCDAVSSDPAYNPIEGELFCIT
jgi:hypothetical protein